MEETEWEEQLILVNSIQCPCKVLVVNEVGSCCSYAFTVDGRRSGRFCLFTFDAWRRLCSTRGRFRVEKRQQCLPCADAPTSILADSSLIRPRSVREDRRSILEGETQYKGGNTLVRQS